MSVAEEEEAHFEQLPESRQGGAEHNVTPGGDRVAWLNASRGRVLGPARTQEVQRGDSIRLSVHGKYKDVQKGKANIGSFISSGAKQSLMTDLLEFGSVTARSAEPNAIIVFNIIDLLAKNLLQKDAPEAYMMYALYDSDSVMYQTGKQVLTKNAANRHEELEEDLYISEDGYMEAFLVNETQEDVWFDDFSIQSTSPFIVQETHYDTSGLELTGLGFQAGGGVKVNRYLYNGNEIQTDLNLNLYDFKARFYDPVTGRFLSVDPLAGDERQVWFSPYQFGWNNPVRFNDPNGECPECEEERANPFKGEIYRFTGGADYVFGKGAWTRQGGTLNEVTVTASRIENGGVIDFDNANLALTAGGAIYGGLEGAAASQGYWLGENGKYYPQRWGGNQHTGSRAGAFRAASAYKLAGRATIGGSAILGATMTYQGYIQDGGEFGYNAQRAAAGSTGSILGGMAGAKAGVLLGGAAGAWIGGVGAIPGAVIGGIVGGFGVGIGGSYLGGHAGESAIDHLHKPKQK